VGQAAWEVLKKEIKDHNLVTGPTACYRTKVGCLRICCHGPTVVVYPEGTWYHGMTADRIPRFVQQHLLDGKPIQEWIFADNPLPCAPAEQVASGANRGTVEDRGHSASSLPEGGSCAD
jgi:(2Fe-2S) ferredoxin